MTKSILGGLAGGFVLYIMGFIFWGTPLSAIAYSRAEGQAAANLQAAMAQALTTTGTGVYIIPDPATAQGTVLYGRGPIATLYYNSNGFPVTDSAALIGGFILSLVVGVLIALALRFVTTDYGARLRVGIIFAVVAALWLDIGRAVFDHAPWGYILYLGVTDFIGLALAAVVGTKIMGRDRAVPGVTTPPPA